MKIYLKPSYLLWQSVKWILAVVIFSAVGAIQIEPIFTDGNWVATTHPGQRAIQIGLIGVVYVLSSMVICIASFYIPDLEFYIGVVAHFEIPLSIYSDVSLVKHLKFYVRLGLPVSLSWGPFKKLLMIIFDLILDISVPVMALSRWTIVVSSAVGSRDCNRPDKWMGKFS